MRGSASVRAALLVFALASSSTVRVDAALAHAANLPAALAHAVRPQPADAAPGAPPGISPSRIRPIERPPIPFDAALAAIGEPVAPAVAPRVTGPSPGSAAETVALRRYVRARQRADEGDPARAAEDIDAALKLDPASPSLRAVRAALAADLGDAGRAVAEWEATLSVAPDDPRAQVAVGAASIDAGQPSRGVALLGRAWRRFRERDFSELSAPARLAVGGLLARGFFRLGFDEAGLEVAVDALGAVAPGERDGDPAKVQASATLALAAGEAALRTRDRAAALGMFALSASFVPDARTVALLAYAQLGSDDPSAARSTLGITLAESPWRDPELTAIAAWMLRALGGDRSAADSLALAAFAAGPGRFGQPAAPPEVRARIARLLVAAGDAEGGWQALDDAVAAGALDAPSLESCLEGAGSESAMARRAMRIVESRPDALWAVCRALVRTAHDSAALRAGLSGLPASPVRDAFAAGVRASLRDAAGAWVAATQAFESAGGPVASRAGLESMLRAAVAAGDPSLVVRTESLASPREDADGAWHASVALAFAESGAATEAGQSIARAELRGVGPGTPAAGALALARGLVDGHAPAGTLRARAEAALASGEFPAAVSDLMLARVTEPWDAAALGALMRTMPASDGLAAAADWIAAELARTPNDPETWRAFVAFSIAAGRAAEALARSDARIAADPGDTVARDGREALLRATGRVAEALAAARDRIESLPAGPRRSLEESGLALQSGDADGCVDALERFSESAFQPPAELRTAALDVCRRVPAAHERRSRAMRRIARDGILADPDGSLEFYAFDALGAATEPSAPAAGALAVARAIADEASSHEDLRSDPARWLGAADFLLAHGAPAAAAEFLRARLEEPNDLDASAVASLARAAVACDAAAGDRARESLALAAQLRALGGAAFGPVQRPGDEFRALAEFFDLACDAAGTEAVLEAGLAVDPDHPDLLNNLGYERLGRGDAGARTAALLERALEERPDSPAVLDSVGVLRMAQGRLADDAQGAGALTLLARALDRAGRNAGAALNEHLGDARWLSGDREGARESWQAAVRAAEAGLDDGQNAELVRRLMRARTGLASMDAVRYHERHDGAVASRARAKLDAAARGEDPMKAASMGAKR